MRRTRVQTVLERRVSPVQAAICSNVGNWRAMNRDALTSVVDNEAVAPSLRRSHADLEEPAVRGFLGIVQRLVACVHEDRVHAEHLCSGLGVRVAAGGGRRRRGARDRWRRATPALPCVSVGSVAAPSEAQPATSSTSAARPPAARARPRRTAPADEQRGDVTDGTHAQHPAPVVGCRTLPPAPQRCR